MVVVWSYLKKTMIGANDRHFGGTVYILNLRIVIAVPVDRSGLICECLGGEFLISCAFRATLLGNVAVWSLWKRAVIGTNDRDVRLSVYILNL